VRSEPCEELRDLVISAVVLTQLVENAGQDAQHANRAEQAAPAQLRGGETVLDQILQKREPVEEAFEEVVGRLDQA